MELKIVIPSHKRADRVQTTSAVDDCILCVAESQKAIYEACNKGIEIVTHPDSVVGLARKRDWIIKHFGNVFMLDDDISHLGRVYSEKGEDSIVDSATATEIIKMTAQACEDAGLFLFGFATSPTPISFNSTKPIELKGYVTGCSHGVLKNSKLWYNADIICNEDYWISLLNAFHHRGIWKDTRFYFHQKDTFVNRGGLAEFRNVDAEEKDFKLLQKVFGSEVIQLRKNKEKMKHPFQKSLRLPF
jgi:hypothetical protein